MCESIIGKDENQIGKHKKRGEQKKKVMKYLKQFMVILAFSFLGEVLHQVLPLPIPASVYGLVFMLAALMTGVLKLHQVKETSAFLIEIMPVMFIPAAAGLIDSWGILQPVIIPLGIITVVTTVFVMVVTGLVTQGIIRKGKKK